MNTQLKRDHTGKVYLFANGVPVQGAIFAGIATLSDGKQYASISVPLEYLSFAEVDNVVPFVRSAER